MNGPAKQNQRWGCFCLWVSGLQYISKALWNLSTSKDPDALMLSISILLTVLTANSALQLACGFATDDILCLTSQVFKNSLVFPAVNCGPPSEINSLECQML